MLVRRKLAALVVVLFLFGGLAVPAHAGGFYVKSLVTNDQSAHHAQLTDANLVNAWGVSHSGGSAFWVSDNGTGVSTLYNVNPASDHATKLGLTVSIPGDGSVTGQVFSGIPGAFHGDAFLFVSEDGTVSGWRGALGTTAETLVAGSSANVYKGVSEATVGGHAYLYAANFLAGKIDVIKGDGAAPSLTGNFKDPTLPAGYSPFDIRLLGGKLYVTYALQNGKDDIAGAGHGFVSVFDLQGNFLARVASQGTLNSPWGLEIAPKSFGALAGDLLVGNFGDGRINAYNLSNNTFAGQLNDTAGNPLTIDGLWSLTTGNNGSAGSSQKLYFTAGPDGESNGLFGVIVAAPAPSTLVISLLQVGVFSAIWYHRRIKGKNTGMRIGGREGPGIPR